MSAAPATAVVTDFGQYAKLRAGAREQSPEALRAAARQFESLLTQQLLKASHTTGFGDDLLGSGGQGDFYRDLFDQQMALHLSSGKGLGIAEMMVRQLQGSKALNASADAGQPLQEFTPMQREKLGMAESTADKPTLKVPEGAAGFVAAIQPHAEKAAKALGVPAEVLIAQAALETGWGKRQIHNADGSASNNFFGIKADRSWQGQATRQNTHEYANGVAHAEKASFRSYGSIAEGFEDYVKFIQGNPRYAEALKHNGDATHYTQGLQKAGYATDPGYAKKIAQIAYGRTMQTTLMAARGATYTA